MAPKISQGAAVENVIKHARSLSYCGRGAILIANPDWSSLTLVPMRCRSWRCPRCAPSLRVKWSGAVAKARPERFITLTCDTKRFPNPDAAYEHLAKAFPRFVAKLRKAGISFEYFAVWEPTEAGWPHIHIAQRGSYVPKKLMDSVWDRLGCGTISDISAIRSPGQTARYITKYMTKCEEGAEFIPWRHRILQYSRRFFPTPPATTGTLIPDGGEAMFTMKNPGDVLATLTQYYGYSAKYVPDTHLWILAREAGPLPDSRRAEVCFALG